MPVIEHSKDGWHFVDYVDFSGGSAVLTPYEFLGHQFKFRINMPRADYLRHREAIIASIKALIASKPDFQQLVYQFKTLSRECIDLRLAAKAYEFVDSGQFTLYAYGQHTDEVIVKDFSRALQRVLGLLGVAPQMPMQRDKQLADNVSIRGEYFHHVCDGVRAMCRFGSRELVDDPVLSACYLSLIGDSNLYRTLSELPARDQEIDDIHQLFFKAYQLQQYVGSEYSVLVCQFALQCRVMEQQLVGGGILSTDQQVRLDALMLQCQLALETYPVLLEQCRDVVADLRRQSSDLFDAWRLPLVLQRLEENRIWAQCRPRVVRQEAVVELGTESSVTKASM